MPLTEGIGPSEEPVGEAYQLATAVFSTVPGTSGSADIRGRPLLAEPTSETMTQPTATPTLVNPWDQWRPAPSLVKGVAPSLGKSGQPLNLNPALQPTQGTRRTEAPPADAPYSRCTGGKGAGKGTGKDLSLIHISEPTRPY